jgi:hypothetical protein
LGLKHPFEGAGKRCRPQKEGYAYSLMSYTAYAGSTGSWVDFEPTTPMLYDLFGHPIDVWRPILQTRSGDDTYVFTEKPALLPDPVGRGGQRHHRLAGTFARCAHRLETKGTFSQLGQPLTYWSEDFSKLWTDRDTVAIAFGVSDRERHRAVDGK